MTWASTLKPSQVANGIFVKLDDNGKYYCAWYFEPVITGYMYMTVTAMTFNRQTYGTSNGEVCTISGGINGSNASGNYSCTPHGDYGKITALITVGQTPPNPR
jgi:hypothetical protein